MSMSALQPYNFACERQHWVETRGTIGQAITYKIHCTKKLLDRLKLPVSKTPSAPTTYLGNWYATTPFWKPQVALLVNERTLLPVLMPLAPAAELALRFPEHLAAVLFDHGAPHALVEHELSTLLDSQYGKTVNRSLVGMLNQFTYLAEGYRDYNQTTDLRWLSMKLSETPCSPLYKKGDFTGSGVAAVV